MEDSEGTFATPIQCRQGEDVFTQQACMHKYHKVPRNQRGGEE